MNNKVINISNLKIEQVIPNHLLKKGNKQGHKIRMDNPFDGHDNSFVVDTKQNYARCFRSSLNIKPLAFLAIYLEVRDYDSEEINFKKKPLTSKEEDIIKQKAKKELDIDISFEQNKYQNIIYSKNRLKEKFFGISKINKSSKVFNNNKSLIYEHVTQERSEDYVSFSKPHFYMYLVHTGKGQRPSLLITKRLLTLGETTLYLKSISKDKLEEHLDVCQKKVLKIICKNLNISVKQSEEKDAIEKDKHELIRECLEKSEEVFEDTLPIPIDEIKKIGNPMKVILNLLSDNLEKDEVIDYLSISDIPEINPDIVEAREVQPFSNNRILITNAKTGKSTNARTIVDQSLVEKPTEANLLGFSDSKEKHYGYLHNRTKPTYLEEVQEEMGEQLFGKLHSYMENGETRISRGLGLECIGYSSLIFQGNPKLEESDTQSKEEILMVELFTNFVDTLSKNYEPLSSRIASTIFSQNIKQVIGRGNNHETRVLASKIIRTIAEGFSDEFSELFKNRLILDYLNKPFSEDYQNTLLELSKSSGDRVVKEYIKGQINSFRHSRGASLRLAWLDVGLETYWKKKEIDPQQIIESAEEHFERIKEINQSSYKNLTGIKSFEILQIYNIKSLPQYLRFIIEAIFDFSKEDCSEIIPVSQLSEHYKTILKSHNYSYNGKYSRFKNAINSLGIGCDKYSRQIEDIGLKYQKSKSCFLIVNKSVFEKVKENFEGTKGTKGTEKRESNSKSEGTKGTKGTEIEFNTNIKSYNDNVIETSNTNKIDEEDKGIQFWEHEESKDILKCSVADSKILKYVKKNPNSSNISIVKHFGNEMSVFNRLNELSKSGKLEHYIDSGVTYYK